MVLDVVRYKLQVTRTKMIELENELNDLRLQEYKLMKLEEEG